MPCNNLYYICFKREHSLAVDMYVHTWLGFFINFDAKGSHLTLTKYDTRPIPPAKKTVRPIKGATI